MLILKCVNAQNAFLMKVKNQFNLSHKMILIQIIKKLNQMEERKYVLVILQILVRVKRFIKRLECLKPKILKIEQWILNLNL